MGKVDENKHQKMDALFQSAYDLFLNQGIEKTSISDIAKKAGVAKGTFYLYFADKYEIRDRLIARTASRLFQRAHKALETADIPEFEDKIIFIVDYVLNAMQKNKLILRFISKNLSWGIFRQAITLFVDMPKLHDKAIIRLDTDEVAKLLDYVESCGSKLTGQALSYYNKTKERDIAIITLLLGTGIRVSELVGLDLSDVDFNNNGVMVTRKGGSQMVVYFGEEVEKALRNYLETYRKAVTPLAGYENALFLSTQRRRIGVQAVENMVKKYASQITNKRITPHKLRSTYGTALYKETGDIYLVADVLGHKDVNTTKKHYAAIDEDRRRSAANVVKLREP